MWKLDHREGCMLKNWCFQPAMLEKTLESLLDCKEIKPVDPKGNQSWIFIGRPPAVKNWLIVKDWCWERLKAGEGDDRGWDGWMTSLTRWTSVWAIFGSWWWTGKPGVLQSTGSQKVGHNWVTELNWWSVILSISSYTCWLFLCLFFEELSTELLCPILATGYLCFFQMVVVIPCTFWI